jgi:CRISPR-associated protein Cas2
MRRTYIVCYDICDPKRLRRVYKTMCGYGDHLQLSVFRCDLTDMALVQMKGDLSEEIHHDEDQVLIIYLGPVDSPFNDRISSLGLPYYYEDDDAIIV